MAQRLGDHLNVSGGVSRPLFYGAVPIEFDTIPIRVTEINSLADAVVGCTLDGDTEFGDSLNRTQPACSVRKQHGKVEQARGSRRGRRPAFTLPAVKAEVVMIAAPRHEGGLRAVALGERHPQHISVELDGPLEIGDFEVDMSDLWIHALFDEFICICNE